jgi:hypothetical protein
MIVSTLVSGLVTGFVFLSGLTVLDSAKSRAARHKSKATRARNRAAKLAVRVDPSPVSVPEPIARRSRSIDLRLADIRNANYSDVMDCVHDDR